MTDCVFCRIAAGTLPSFKLAEDDLCVAFMDINPSNPGHVLVVGREHAPDILTVSPTTLTAVAAMAQRVAKAVQKVVSPDGINLLQANGPGARQSVLHFHMHVMPRRLGDDLPMNWDLNPGDMAEIGALAKRIQAAMEG